MLKNNFKTLGHKLYCLLFGNDILLLVWGLSKCDLQNDLDFLQLVVLAMK